MSFSLNKLRIVPVYQPTSVKLDFWRPPVKPLSLGCFWNPTSRIMCSILIVWRSRNLHISHWDWDVFVVVQGPTRHSHKVLFWRNVDVKRMILITLNLQYVHVCWDIFSILWNNAKIYKRLCWFATCPLHNKTSRWPGMGTSGSRDHRWIFEDHGWKQSHKYLKWWELNLSQEIVEAL